MLRMAEQLMLKLRGGELMNWRGTGWYGSFDISENGKRVGSGDSYIAGRSWSPLLRVEELWSRL